MYNGREVKSNAKKTIGISTFNVLIKNANAQKSTPSAEEIDLDIMKRNQQNRVGVDKGTSGGKSFKTLENLEKHYVKHGTEMKNTFNKSKYTAADYLNDANHVAKSGTYMPELNGYVKLVGGKGSAKYAFVGIDRATGEIMTFHLKTVSELIKKAPSLGLSK